MCLLLLAGGKPGCASLINLKIFFLYFAVDGKSTYHFCENSGTFCVFLSSVAGNQRKVPDMAYGQQVSALAFAFCSGDKIEQISDYSRVAGRYDRCGSQPRR
jgi:hypothetical protein